MPVQERDFTPAQGVAAESRRQVPSAACDVEVDRDAGGRTRWLDRERTTRGVRLAQSRETRRNAGRQLRLLVQAELRIGPREMNANRMEADAQPSRDRLGFAAGGDKNRDLELASGQHADEIGAGGRLILAEDRVSPASNREGPEHRVGKRSPLIQRDNRALHSSETKAREGSIRRKRDIRLPNLQHRAPCTWSRNEHRRTPPSSVCAVVRSSCHGAPNPVSDRSPLGCPNVQETSGAYGALTQLRLYGASMAVMTNHGSRTILAGPARARVGSASAPTMSGMSRTPLLTLPGGASTVPRLQPCERPSASRMPAVCTPMIAGAPSSRAMIGLPLWPGQVSTVCERRRASARTRRSVSRHIVPTGRSDG